MRKMSEAFDLLEEELVWRPNRQGEMRGEGRRRELARMSLPVALGDRWVVIYTNIVSVQTHTLTPGTKLPQVPYLTSELHRKLKPYLTKSCPRSIPPQGIHARMKT